MIPRHISFIIAVVTAAAVVQGIVLVIAVMRSRNALAEKLPLAALMLAFSISLLHVRAFVRIDGTFTPFGVYGEPSQLLFGPLIFLYFRGLVGKRHHPAYALHLLPFIGALILIALLHASHASTAGTVIAVTAFLQIVVYLVMCHYSLHQYRTSLLTKHSAIREERFSLLRAIMIAIGICYLLKLPVLVMLTHGGPEYLDDILALLLAAAVYAVGYSSFLPAVTSPAEAAEPYKGSRLSAKESRKHYAMLCARMDGERLYKDPELTLKKLASIVDTPYYLLSQMINENSGSNFFDFVNRRRVDEVKRLFDDASMKGFTMLDIALEAGFNSKATFNKVFKSVTGMTPSAFSRRMPR